MTNLKSSIKLLFNFVLLTRRNHSALSKRVSSETSWTGTDGVVVDHLAVSLDSASSDARIFTLLLDASEVSRTFGIDDALRPAERRSSGVPWQARASLMAVDNLALGIGATG